MKKQVLSFLLAALLLLAALPASAAADDAAAPVSGDLFTEHLTTDMVGVNFDTAFNMVFVEGGTFTLGWEAEDASQRPENVNPVRNVTVSDFYIGETEVTVSMWNAVMGLDKPGADANRPKEYVSFYQAQEFLTRLYVLTGRTYRLITEAEWEFAAKGGNPGKTGNDEYPGNNHKYLFAGSNIHDEVVASHTAVADVKTKKPNILGIYDLCGNAEEWVYDTWDAAHVGGVDPVGPAGPFHQQKTRRGGTYGGTSADSTRTLSARQIRSIDGGAGMGFRIALSGDMNSVPPNMIRPKDVVHPDIDERNLPVTYRDARWITGDDMVWHGSFGGFLQFDMKLWETGEMVLRSAGYPDRAGQWYTVSNLGIVFVENAFEETEQRMTLPYLFLTPDYASVINDVSFTGDGAPVNRFERLADTGVGIEKPTDLKLYAPEELAAASTHDHTSYDLNEITEEMKGHDERLIDGEGFGWWLSASVGIHQYRQDITPDTFRFVVYSPGFGAGFGNGGADAGYGANYLAQGSWYTVNDMLLVIETGTSLQHYLYTVTEETGSYILPGKSAKQLMQISYMDYEKGDLRFLERHPNEAVRGYSKDIPNTWFWSMGGSTFHAEPQHESQCPGGCGEVISRCKCPTVCPDCGEHIDRCCCKDAAGRLSAGTKAAETALKAYAPANTVTLEHLDAEARLAIGLHQIARSWSDFTKVNATREQPGSVSARLTLSLNGQSEAVDVKLTIPALPESDGAGLTIQPEAAVGGKPVKLSVTDVGDEITVFDIGSMYGMPGAFGYTYALWFGSEGTFAFDRDVTLSKTYFDSSFAMTGTDQVTVKAGEIIRIADGVYSEVKGETVSWSEFALSLDGGNSIVIIDSAEPGNYVNTPADTPLAEFPGTVNRSISVTVNGKAVAWTDAIPFIDENSRTMVPLRAVGNALGLTVDWDGEKREAIFTDGTRTLYFPIGSSTARSGDGGTVDMDTAAVIVGARTYAPVRYLAEFFGHTVGWDNASRTVLIQ